MLKDTIQNMLQRIADGVVASIPRRPPAQHKLRDCRIVSHRGEHDNKNIMENTLAAFDLVVESGVWGIEFDIRWTKDLFPVVIHDADCQRVFGSPRVVAEHSLGELQAVLPQIPSLQQVIRRYGKKTHLMVELKHEVFPHIDQQRNSLRTMFEGLTPGQDFHLVSLESALFDLFDIAPKSAMMLIAETNFKAISQKAIVQNYAGISGQYLLMSNRLIKKHTSHQQKVGTGFASSRYCFYRELNRDVEWIFTNHAIKLSNIRRQLLSGFE